MTLEEYKKYQKRSLKEFQARAAGPERTAVAKETRERLIAAKIIDGSGKLAKQYR